MRQIALIAALFAVAGHADGGVLQVACHGTVGPYGPMDFVLAIDLASVTITDVGFRWSTTDDDTTIDWDLDRQSGVLRAVILTGPDAGLPIAGECDKRIPAR